MSSLLPLNAISCVTIQGLVSENGAIGDQTLHRGIVEPGEYLEVDVECIKRPGGLPSRVKPLIPPGDVHLEVCLGEELGSGRAGLVHAVDLLSPDNVGLPPLVVKISRPHMSLSIAQEAWFYEELEQLQGVAVPRCYGFFQARLKGVDSSAFLGSLTQPPPDPDHDESITSNFHKECEDYEKRVPGQGQLLSILVLERLGSHMPIGKPIDSIQDEIYQLFDDLARLGIEPLDIRYSNIVSAREGDTLGLVCPNHGYVHNWRLVDFDMARKMDALISFINGNTGSWLHRLFRNLVVGLIIEPWEL